MCGDALKTHAADYRRKEIGRKRDITESDVEAISQVRDARPAEPMKLESSDVRGVRVRLQKPMAESEGFEPSIRLLAV